MLRLAGRILTGILQSARNVINSSSRNFRFRESSLYSVGIADTNQNGSYSLPRRNHSRTPSASLLAEKRERLNAQLHIVRFSEHNYRDSLARNSNQYTMIQKPDISVIIASHLSWSMSTERCPPCPPPRTVSKCCVENSCEVMGHGIDSSQDGKCC